MDSIYLQKKTDLSKFGERASVRDQTRANNITNERGQRWRNGGHFIAQVILKFLAIIGQRDDFIGEDINVHQVKVGNVHSH